MAYWNILSNQKFQNVVCSPFLEESTKGYKPLMLIHTANQHSHFISLGSCYTKFNSPLGMANRVLITNIPDSHQATSNDWFLVWIREYSLKITAS